MAYCRSSNDCDVYAYESVFDVWMIHVAHNGLPKGRTREFDGATFECKTLQKFCDKMMEIRRAGYRIPDEVLERIREEMK